MITLDNLERITSNIVPTIGDLGGRRFYYNSQSFSMNELYKHLSHYSNPTEHQALQINRILTHLKEKDREGDELLSRKNLLIKILTAIRRLFGSKLDRISEHEKLSYKIEPLITEFNKRNPLISAIRALNLPSDFDPEEIGHFAQQHLLHFIPGSRVKGPMCTFYTDMSAETFIIFKKKHSKALIGKGSQSIVVHAISMRTLERKAYYRTLLNNNTAIELYDDEKDATQRLGQVKGLISLHSTKTYFRRRDLKRISIAPFYPCGDLYNQVEKKLLTIENKRNIMRALIDTVKKLHQSNVIHRDIKLENILLQDYNTPLLADVGFMVISAPSSKTNKNPCGSPHYAAPELIFNSISSVKNDVWSLGVTLFALFKEAMPYSNQTNMRSASKGLDLNDPYENAIAEMLTYDHHLRPSLDQIRLP